MIAPRRVMKLSPPRSGWAYQAGTLSRGITSWCDRWRHRYGGLATPKATAGEQKTCSWERGSGLFRIPAGSTPTPDQQHAQAYAEPASCGGIN